MSSIASEDSCLSGVFAMATLPEDRPAENGRGGVFSASFLALVATQFFVSLNDNMFRWLVVPIGKELIDKSWIDMPAGVKHWMQPETLALSLGLACFTLPFLLFASPAGFLADRFSKRNVMVACKAAEIVVVALGVTAIVAGSLPGMFLVLFILGGQAMMFITSKLGAIPEIVRSEKIAAANGLINMVSMAAIIIGTVAGNWLYALTQPAGLHRWWLSAGALVGVATCGLITSLFIGPLPVANATRRIPWNLTAQTVRDLRTLASHRAVFLATLGSTYFWALAALSQVNIDQFGTRHLFLPQQFVGPLLAALMIGIGIGAPGGRGMLAGQGRIGTRALGRHGHRSDLDSAGHRARRRPRPTRRGRLLRQLLLALGDGHDRRTVRHSFAGVCPGPQPAAVARLDHGGLQLPGFYRHVGRLGRVLAVVGPAWAFPPAAFSWSAALLPCR